MGLETRLSLPHADLEFRVEPPAAQHRMHRERLRQDAAVQRRLEQLTSRETEVLELIIAGRLNKQIADDLGISIKTVEVHRARVMEKMEANSLAELVQSVMTCEAARGRFVD